MIARTVGHKVAVVLFQLVEGGTEVANGKVTICRPVSKKTSVSGKWTHQIQEFENSHIKTPEKPGLGFTGAYDQRSEKPVIQFLFTGFSVAPGDDMLLPRVHVS